MGHYDDYKVLLAALHLDKDNQALRQDLDAVWEWLTDAECSAAFDEVRLLMSGQPNSKPPGAELRKQ